MTIGTLPIGTEPISSEPISVTDTTGTVSASITVTVLATVGYATAPIEVDVIIYDVKANLNITVSSNTGTATLPISVLITDSSTATAPLAIHVNDDTSYQSSVIVSEIVGTSGPVYWDLAVVIGGVTLTQRMVGAITVEKTPNAAAIAEFSILSFNGVVDVAAYVGQPVTISYNSTKCFTGIVDSVHYDVNQNLCKFLCTDGLQLIFEKIAGETNRQVAVARQNVITAENARNLKLHQLSMNPVIDQTSWDTQMAVVEAAITAAQTALHVAETRTATEIKALVGGLWSKSIFSPASGWDTFNDLMSTQTANYALDSNGSGVTTSWTAKTNPDFTFTEDDYIFDNGVVIDRLVSAKNVINSIDIKFEYRYTKLFEYNFAFTWAPNNDYIYYATFSGTPLPDHDRLASAVQSAGFAVNAYGDRYGKTLPISGLYAFNLAPIPGPGTVVLEYSPTDMNHEAAYLADIPRYSAVGAATMQVQKRYSQTRTETVILSITAPQSIKQTGRINKSISHGVEVETYTDNRLAKKVANWEETTSETIIYKVSDGVTSYQKPDVDHGDVAATTITSVPLSVTRYVWSPPDLPLASDVVSTLPGAVVRTWNVDTGSLEDRTERDNAFDVVKAIANNTIIGSHRDNVISFVILAKPELELSHTVKVTRTTPAFAAKGLVETIRHVFNIEEGSALTEVSIALIKPWSTGVHYVDPYVPPPDQGTIIYPGSLFTSELTNWPLAPRNLWGLGNAPDLQPNPPDELRFRGYNWFSGDFIIENPPTPQEAVSAFIRLTHEEEQIVIPDDLLTIEA